MLIICYSASTGGFYPLADKAVYEAAGSWPDDAVEMTPDEKTTYWSQNPPLGMMLGSLHGRPVWVELPKPSPEQLAAEALSRRDALLRIAAIRIAPLQDAVDLDDATPEDVALLKKWKQYRVAVNRIQDQAGFPSEINWPVAPE